MADINEILGRQINNVKELKKAISDLQNSLIGVDASSEEFKTTSEQLAAAQEELNKVTRAGKQENDAAKDSIVGMKNEYKALYDQYKLLSDEQRNSDFGKNMADSLETLSQKINETQKGVGSFKDNIGNYAGSISDAFGKMGISVGALKGPLDAAKTGGLGLNAAFKTLAANPIMLAITTIVAILVKAAAAIKQNEELTMRLQQALSVFKPILDAVSNAFDFLAGLIVKAVEGFANFSAKVMSIIPGMGKAIKSHQELAKATNELTKAQRENSVVLSKKQSEVETLRAEAAATTDVTEKRKLLEEAKAKQAEIDQEYVNMAQEELRIMQEYAKKTANSTEANNKLAAAQKKVNDAIAAGQKHQKEYNEQLKTTTQAINNQSSAGKNYREEAKKIYEQTLENNKTEIQKLTEKYEKEKKLLEKYHYDTTLLTKKYNADINKIEREAAAIKYQQRRDDNERELNLLRSNGKEEIALGLEAEKLENVTIPAVKKLDETVTNFLSSFRDDSKMPDLDAVFAKMKEMEDFINDNTFEALGDEFKTIKDAVRAVNDEFGLSITTVSNLETTIGELETKLENINKEYNNLVDEKAGEEQIKKIQDAIKENYEAGLEGLIKTVSYDSFEGYTVFMAEQEAKALEVEKAAIEEELSNFSGTTEQKLEIMQRYYEVLAEMRENDQALTELNQQRTQEMVENLSAVMDNIGNALGTLKGSYESLIDSEVKAGEIDEKTAEEKKKRLEKLEIAQQAFSIATIAADAASGLFSIWKGYATEVGVINPQTAAAAGPGAAISLGALNAKSLISAIAKTTSLAATATAQIMAARNGIITAKNNMSAAEGGGSVGVAATPATINTQPYSYSRTVQTEDDEDFINQRPIIVRVSDILDGIDTHNVQVQESSF